MSDANRNQLWARALVEELVRAGVRDVCVAPGSRSTALVLACAGVDGVRVLPHLDERSAGFFALGVGRATRRPAAVITTSGTATANLLPAVMEASWAEVPLLLLTADRPPHLRNADANQAVDQSDLYGGYVRAFFDLEPPRVDGRSIRNVRTLASRAVAAARGAPPGPVHLNVPFRKPLEPTPVPGDVDDDFPRDHPRAARGRPEGAPYVRMGVHRSAVDPTAVERIAGRLRGARGLVVAGPSAEADRTGPAVRRLAARWGLPLLADPLSGARGAGEAEVPVVRHYDLLLRDPRVREALRPEAVVRVGASPTSAALLEALEEWGDAWQVVVDDGHRFKDHLAVAREYVPSDPAGTVEAVADAASGGGADGEAASAGPWASRWSELDAVVAGVVEDALRGELFEATVLAAAADALPGEGALFVSNSMPVRDLDAFVGSLPGSAVYANRGASGIDGIVSTALGVAHGRKGPVTAVVGDLAFYHDMNGLLAARRSRGRVTFVVIHNDGGGIFHMLPVRRFDPPFTELFATPHGLDFRHAAALYDLPYARVSGGDELRRALAEGSGDAGARIVEVRTDREHNRRRHEEVEAAVRRAVGARLEGHE